MCSIVEEDFGDEGGAHLMVEPKSDEPLLKNCKKCNEKAVVAKLMCAECFIISLRHKFRASLGSTKIVRRHSTVLLHFTGTAESVCLTEMIRFAFEEATHKRLCFDLELVFIDENCLSSKPLDVDQRIEKLGQVTKVLAQFPSFKCHHTSIAFPPSGELKLIDEISKEDMSSIMEGEEKFKLNFNSLKSLTSKQDFLDVTRSDILRHSAVALKCQYVFLCDTSIELANRLISKVSLGRGSSVALDVAFCDDRVEAIKFVRPIKELIAQDARTYANIENLAFLEPSSFGDDYGQHASIQNLTSRFIGDLQQNFPSTVSTVFRTCNKIMPTNDAAAVADDLDVSPHFASLNLADQTKRCIICKSFLDYTDSETLHAIAFSREVSSMKEVSNNSKPLQSSEAESQESSLRNHFCHGCQNIFIGLDEVKEFF